jgi:hypothetical protein
MSKTVKTINIIIFFAWVTLIALLLYRNYTGTPLEKAQALKEAFGKETYWYDIYAGTKKIGFAMTTFEKAGDEIIIKHEREMKVKKNGEDKLLIERLKCLSDLYYSIKSFEYSTQFKDEGGIKATGEVDKDTIIFFLESPEKRKTHKTPTNGKIFYLPVTLIPAIQQKNPVPNTVFLIPMLNFINLSIDDVRVVLEEIRPLKVGMNIMSLYKFRVGNSILWSNEKGITIKEEYPSGIILYSQIENIAKDPADRILFDYTSLPFFKPNKLISHPEELNLLKVRIDGFRLEPQLYENSFVTLKNNILTMEKEDIEHIKSKIYKLPYAEGRLDKYLNPDEWVSSNYKPLQDTGRIYARSYNNDAFPFTKYLTGYLFQLIRTMPMFVISDSANILKSLSGDYLERTVMFASYSRAAGLPTRFVGGIVYLNGYFYFHTWPEVWFDKWIPVDPTLAQFPADVTHIPLREGTLKDITSIVKDLENLKIEILEAS